MPNCGQGIALYLLGAWTCGNNGRVQGNVPVVELVEYSMHSSCPLVEVMILTKVIFTNKKLTGYDLS